MARLREFVLASSSTSPPQAYFEGGSRAHRKSKLDSGSNAFTKAAMKSQQNSTEQQTTHLISHNLFGTVMEGLIVKAKNPSLA